jgi:hypothetical protein
MPSAFLSRNSFNQLKRVARQQLPGVQHAHALEALARALGQNNLASLKAKLSFGEDNAPRFFIFSYDQLRIRLLELGYEDATKWNLDFSGVTDVFRVKKAFPMTLDALVADGTISLEQRNRLGRLIEQRKSILIIGTTGSRKTILMHVLLSEMSARAPNEEFVLCQTIHEGPEYGTNVKRFIRDEFWPGGYPSFGARRVAFDELRDDTALKVLRSWAAFGGGLATLHARSVEEVFSRLTSLMGGRAGELIRDAVDVIVRMESSGHGITPKIAEIATREEAAQAMQRSAPGAAGKQATSPDARERNVMPDDGVLSFTPKLWRQVEDGSWVPTGFFGHTRAALYGRMSDAIEKERMEEMKRILNEGGRAFVINPKADAGMEKALARSGLMIESTIWHTDQDAHAMLRAMNEIRDDAPTQKPAPDTTDDAKAD